MGSCSQTKQLLKILVSDCTVKVNGVVRFMGVYAAINGHLELTLLKGFQRFERSRRRILRYINFEFGESSPYLFSDMVNLPLVIFEAW